MSSLEMKKCEKNSYEKAMQDMANSLLYRAVFDSGEAVTAEEYETILKQNQELFLLLFFQKNEKFMKWLSTTYSIDVTILEYMINADLTVYKGIFSSKHGQRVETINTKIFNRLTVQKRNHDIIEKLCNDYSLRRISYFDIGCLFGYSMISACRLGFETAEGCELDSRLFLRAEKLMELTHNTESENIVNGSIKYYREDFLKLDLKQKYELVTVIDVLEHTPNLENTIKGISEILLRGGVCYIFQGNHNSLQYVLSDPHYRLPLVSILPKDIVCAILIKIGNIEKEENYVVTDWPELEKLVELFIRYKLKYEIPLNGYIQDVPLVSAKKLDDYRKKIFDKYEEKIKPLIDEQMDKEIVKCANEYFDMVYDELQSNPLKYKRNWEIILRSDGTDEN